MSLLRIEKINQNLAWGLWKIEEDSQKLAEKLYPYHHAIAENPAILELKKCESLASRLVVRKILESWGLDFQGIKKDECQKPYITGLNYHVSLTHTQNYAAAIVDKRSFTGIDIELIREKVQKVAHKFLSEKELIASENDIEKLTLYWSAKEVLYKTYGKKRMSLRQHILIENFDLAKRGKLLGIINFPEKLLHQKYELAYRKIENIYICYVCNRLTI